MSIDQLVAGASSRFRALCKRARAQQEENLREILNLAQSSAFGQAKGFGKVRSLADFRQACPIHHYEDLEPWITPTTRDGENRLVNDPVLGFEETSGSTSARKIIPITSRGLQAIQSAIKPWMDDLFLHYPGIIEGRWYWAISPGARPTRHTAAGHRIGLENDADYFGADAVRLLVRQWAVSPETALTDNVARWRTRVLEQLANSADLAFISVWSPTFLSNLMGHLIDQAGEILPLLTDRERRESLCAALESDTFQPHKLWPKLTLISCWTDGFAARYVAPLRNHFPGVTLQGKGLMATEGVVTIPCCDLEAPVLALESGFYEFMDDRGNTLLCDELTPGQDYAVIMTSYSGLFRYRLGDRVRVMGYEHEAPLLKLIGRASLSCDLCGEKLTEAFVNSRLNDYEGFALLAPAPSERPQYRLYLEAGQIASTEALSLAARLDNRLRSNPQYEHARRVGQLAPIEPWCVPEASKQYKQHLERITQAKAGVVKLTTLSPDAEWADRFHDSFPVSR